MIPAIAEALELISVRRKRSRGLPRAVPERLTVQVTNLCDSRCTHCGIWKIYRENPELFSDELRSSEWAILLNDAIDSGVRKIDITGGEPFLKKGVDDLVRLLLERLKFTCVTTNGLRPTTIAERIRRILERTGEDATLVVSVSIDGLSKTYAEIRGIEDGFSRALELLGSLRGLKGPFPNLLTNVSFTITDRNVDDFEPLMERLLADGLLTNPDEFTFRPVQSSHYYRKTNDVEAAGEIAAAIARVRKTHRFERNRRFIDGIVQSLQDPGRMLLPCQAMFTSCWIDPYGNVAPCVTMTDRWIGNVRDTDLRIGPVWHSDEAEAVRDEVARAACPVCWTDCQAHENIRYSPLRARQLGS